MYWVIVVWNRSVVLSGVILKLTEPNLNITLEYRCFCRQKKNNNNETRMLILIWYLLRKMFRFPSTEIIRVNRFSGVLKIKSHSRRFKSTRYVLIVWGAFFEGHLDRRKATSIYLNLRPDNHRNSYNLQLGIRDQFTFTKNCRKRNSWK